ncbi:hypothetical protein ACH48_18940 [Aeromonas caviae]|nr:hypothetical protein ACH48_18940 [Aeromonas caviae]
MVKFYIRDNAKLLAVHLPKSCNLLKPSFDSMTLELGKRLNLQVHRSAVMKPQLKIRGITPHLTIAFEVDSDRLFSITHHIS